VNAIRIAKNFPRTRAGRIAWLRFVGTRLEGNPLFPAPPIPITTFLAGIAALEAAQTATLTRAHGTATARDAELALRMADLDLLIAYVESVARQRADRAEEIIASSGLSLKQSTRPQQHPFKVKQLARSGSVQLAVTGEGRGRSYDWQLSTDGTHWVDLPRTTYASTTATGLIAGTRYSFRYRTLKGRTLGDWSDAYTLLVV
jgi:hypothetical protein